MFPLEILQLSKMIGGKVHDMNVGVHRHHSHAPGFRLHLPADRQGRERGINHRVKKDHPLEEFSSKKQKWPCAVASRGILNEMMSGVMLGYLNPRDPCGGLI
jgi:hypothetical protein